MATLSEQALQYLSNKGISIESASDAQISDAVAYGTCYNWYINNQKVLPNTADLASTIFVQKYALHDNAGICLEMTPEDMWNRIASTLAKIEMSTNKANSSSQEEWKSSFVSALKDYKYVLGGSGLSAVGNTYSLQSAANCYVIRPPQDDMTEIFRVCSDMANIQKYRGGTGIDISNLRPAGAAVSNSAKESSGATSFMDLFSKVTATVGQRGRCIEENQVVLTKRGSLAIKDVMPGDLVWTSTGWVRNISTLNNGVKQVFRLTTKRGFDIIATENHIFTASEGGNLVEKQLSELSVGDSVVTLPGTNVEFDYVGLDTNVSYNQGHGAMNAGNRLNSDISLPSYLTEDLAYFLGYCYGDGNIDYDKFNEPTCITLACATAHPEIDNKLTGIMRTCFSGYEPKHHKGDGAVVRLRIASKRVCLFLQNNGLLKQLHHSLILPEKVKASCTSVQLAFLSGYFDADGYASGSKKGYVISSVCLPMIKELQHILMSSGIVSHISSEARKQDSHRDLFSLSITGAASQSRAMSVLSESIKIQNRAFVSKRDNNLTPFKAKSLGVTHNKHSFVPDNTQLVSCSVYSKLASLGLCKDNMLVNDSVLSVEPLGLATVYDLQLESHHLFYCQGFNVHNSGATMISLRSSHPDVFAFINEKQDLDKQWFFNELAEAGIDINDWKHTSISTKLKNTTKANVSLRVDDKLMQAIESDGDYTLWYDFKNTNKYENIRKIVKARDIWHSLVAANVKSAEPGILFWDTIISQSVPDCYGSGSITLADGKNYTYDFTTLGVNPCQCETTEFLTKDSGIKQLKDINIGDVVWTGFSWSELINKWSTGVKPVYRYRLSNNSTLEMTANHRVVSNGTKVEIKDATSIDRQLYIERSFGGNTNELALIAGMVLGDGSQKTDKRAYLNIGEKDAEMETAALKYTLRVNGKNCVNTHDKQLKLTYSFKDLELEYAPVWERKVSDYWKQSSSETMCQFLRGLYTANGSVLAKGSRIALKTSSEVLASDVLMMLESLGIRSYITINKPATVNHHNGTYTSKTSYDVNTCDTATFAKLIGFEQQYKMGAINKTKGNGTPRKVTIVSSEYIGDMEVFDYTVAAPVHTVMQKGFLVSNCAELSLNNDACSIGSLFLYAFVKSPFTETAEFDFTEFERVARLAVRMQDNVREYDMDYLPLEEYKTSAILGRRIGIGIHGLSDTLAALGFKYDTEEAVKMAGLITNKLKNIIYDESVTLGQEKGVFPIWDWEKECNNPYLNSLDEAVLDRVKSFGRRNIACQTIAPTGSISILSRNCSSGIEPVFKKSYTRSVKKQGSEDTVLYTVHHQALQDCLDAGGDPSLFVEANDINWEMRIKMQSACQKNIDHSISSTVNLPKNTTEETVSNIYMSAWKHGLKGITTYVDECRSGVLNSIKDPAANKKHKLVERPKVTNIDIHKVKYKDKQWAVLVGRADNGPIEIFAGIEEETPLPNKYHKAELTKKSRGHYSLTVFLSEDGDDVIKISNIGARFPSPEGMALTRFISLALRNGVSVADIHEQLSKSATSMFSYPFVLQRVLKNYIPDDILIEAERAKNKPCPDCGNELEYKRESGCMTEYCSSCGYSNSKCG